MKNSAKIRWEEMLPHEFLEAREKFPVGYMAYGLAEPHGGFNALGLDWLKANGLVEAAAQEQGGIVAPPFAWHIQEVPEFHDDGKGNGWLVDVGVKQSLCGSIPADLFYRTVFYQIRAFDARGLQAGVFVTGHYGGVELILRKIAEFYLRRTGSPIRLLMIADCEVIDAGLPYRGDHAGICETSQLMALRPDLVDLTRTTTGSAELGERFAGGVNFAKGPLPSVEIGRKIVDSQVKNLAAAAKKLVEEFKPKANWVAPDLNETEKIWVEFEKLTRKYWTVTYDQYRTNTSVYGKFPSWEEMEMKKE